MVASDQEVSEINELCHGNKLSNKFISLIGPNGKLKISIVLSYHVNHVSFIFILLGDLFKDPEVRKLFIIHLLT